MIHPKQCFNDSCWLVVLFGNIFLFLRKWSEIWNQTHSWLNTANQLCIPKIKWDVLTDPYMTTVQSSSPSRLSMVISQLASSLLEASAHKTLNNHMFLDDHGRLVYYLCSSSLVYFILYLSAALLLAPRTSVHLTIALLGPKRSHLLYSFYTLFKVVRI